MEHAARLRALGRLLEQHQPLWRAQPFYEPWPVWCERHPSLARTCLALPDDELEDLSGDNARLLDWAADRLPDLAELKPLIRLPRAESPPYVEHGRAHWHVPGRKQRQIHDFTLSVGRPVAPLLEWCSGKGHLGRALGMRWALPVTSLDHDPKLCAEGQSLAELAGLNQQFVQADALDPESAHHLKGRHAIALHACGDLHRSLINGVAETGSPALDLSPCCYYKTASPRYLPYTPDAELSLSRDELHLAVSETATAGRRERRLRDKAMARKLAYLALHRDLTGRVRPAKFKPVPGSWLALPASDWLRALAEREGLAFTGDTDWDGYAARGWRRQREVMRLSLVRLVFRRPLEIWLALDRALFLERAGYDVRLSEFCPADVTPRNLLISARK